MQCWTVSEALYLIFMYVMCNALILVTKEALETVEIFRNREFMSISTHMFKKV